MVANGRWRIKLSVCGNNYVWKYKDIRIEYFCVYWIWDWKVGGLSFHREGHLRMGDMKLDVISTIFSYSVVQIDVGPKSHRES